MYHGRPFISLLKRDGINNQNQSNVYTPRVCEHIYLRTLQHKADLTYAARRPSLASLMSGMRIDLFAETISHGEMVLYIGSILHLKPAVRGARPESIQLRPTIRGYLHVLLRSLYILLPSPSTSSF